MVMSPKLIAVVVVALLVAGVAAYVLHLQGQVDALRLEVAEVTTQRDNARAQVIAVTEAKDEVTERQEQAEKANAKLRGDLARARGRVQTVTIPSQCDDALNWLAEELK